ncbi:MAG: hypothetical protein RLY86_1269 [Pseudomonadota bacterium]|jgi:hypothetical protein
MGQASTILTDLGAVQHPDLRRFLAYWQDKRQGRCMPSRRDVDPLEFSWILGRVSLVEVGEEEPRFRYRLLASTLADHLGYEVTGRSTADIPEPEMRAYVEGHYIRVTESRLPHADRGDMLLDGRLWRSEALYLPLSADDGRVDMILVARITDRPRRPRHLLVNGAGPLGTPSRSAKAGAMAALRSAV